ncbi:MAG: DUF2877 domain-containing protein [Chloroflexi bacterium]|nr:DUF2877 domain-containing protein [Chloroflexota bacterium]
MQSIKALSITPDARKWLTNSRHPHILHIFDHACNLINERKEVLSIVTREIGNGPFNLVIDVDIFFSEHLDLKSPISNSHSQLTLGDLTIHTVNAKLWSPRPDWEALHAKRDHIIKLLLANHQKGGLPLRGLRDMPFTQTAQGCSTTSLNPNVPITEYQFSNSLISALANADLPTSLTATPKIAGLGIGLTPAGDDFILGAVLAAWIIHPPEIARVLAEEITNVAAPLTTSLSAAWLRSAGRGEAGILWHEFFDALSLGDSSAIQLQINKLLSIGHTSGADALAGFIGVFISFKEHILTSCPS